jgi:hypothetical protein
VVSRHSITWTDGHSSSINVDVIDQRMGNVHSMPHVISVYCNARGLAWLLCHVLGPPVLSILHCFQPLISCHRLRPAHCGCHAQAEFARVECWGTLGEWIERDGATAAAHLDRVAHVVSGAPPSRAGAERLAGATLFEKLLEGLTDVVAEAPQRGPAMLAVRAAAAAAARSDGDAAAGSRDGGNGADGATTSNCTHRPPAVRRDGTRGVAVAEAPTKAGAQARPDTDCALVSHDVLCDAWLPEAPVQEPSAASSGAATDATAPQRSPPQRRRCAQRLYPARRLSAELQRGTRHGWQRWGTLVTQSIPHGPRRDAVATRGAHR